MTATLVTAAGILKEVYEGTVNDQLQSEEVTSKRIEKTSSGVFSNAGGKYVVFPVRTKRNHGISYRDEMTQLAPARKQGYAQAQETLKAGYVRAKFSGHLMDLAEEDEQAFIDGAEREITQAVKDNARDVNRIIIGNRVAFAATGATGIITRLTATTTGTTLTVSDSFQVEQDMLIDIVDNSGVPVTGGTGRVVVGVTDATTVEVDSEVAGATSGNNICRSGNFNKEPYGILPLVNSTGTLHGINSGTAGNEYWQSTVDASTTTLTEMSMITLLDNVRKKSGKIPTAIFCSQGVRRAYQNVMMTLRRYNEPKEFTGGLYGLGFMYDKELPLVVDVDLPASTLAAINEDEIKIYRRAPWKWQDKDGSMFKWVTDYDSWEAMMKQYWQIVTHQRNAHGIMTTVTEV